MRTSVFFCLGILLGTALVSGETEGPVFGVATVKPATPGVGGNRVGMTHDTLTMSNVTLAICLKLAYGVQDGQIAGPEFLNSERFDIVAKAAAPFSDMGQMKAMLQALLASRFGLRLHRENKEQSVFALVVGKDGPKFRRSVGEGKSNLMGKQTVVAQWVPMKLFADYLSGPMRRPVVDATGLEGQYDFKFDLTAMLPPDVAPGQEPDVAAMVLSGLPEQLGLRLESRKMPVDTLVVDHVEKPGEN